MRPSSVQLVLNPALNTTSSPLLSKLPSASSPPTLPSAVSWCGQPVSPTPTLTTDALTLKRLRRSLLLARSAKCRDNQPRVRSHEAWRTSILLERSTFFFCTLITFLLSLSFLFSHLLFIFAFLDWCTYFYTRWLRIYIDAHMYI